MILLLCGPPVWLDVLLSLRVSCIVTYSFSGGHVISCVSTWLWFVLTAMWLWLCG